MYLRCLAKRRHEKPQAKGTPSFPVYTCKFFFFFVIFFHLRDILYIFQPGEDVNMTKVSHGILSLVYVLELPCALKRPLKGQHMKPQRDMFAKRKH